VLRLGSTELYYDKKFEAVTLMMLNAVYCYVVTNNTILHPIRRPLFRNYPIILFD